MNRQVETLSPRTRTQGARTPWWLVAGGKGGVGKSTVAVNLALAAAKSGRRVLLVDLDLGLGNLHVHLGTAPESTLEAFLEGERPLSELVAPVFPSMDLLAAASGSHHLARLDSAQRRRLMDAVDQLALGYDVVIADGPAGIGPDLLAFAARADLVLCVTTPDPAALADAYGLVKALDAWSGERGHSLPTPDLVVNCAAGLEQAEALHRRLQGVCEQFLQRRPRLVAWLPRAGEVERSIACQVPLVQGQPGSTPGRAFQRLADRLCRERLQPIVGQRA